ncbi:MAG TPA: ABC transporter permease [Candidatus Limnocylindrales bacterium]
MSAAALLRRLAWSGLAVLAAAVLTFGLVYLVPADPVRVLVGPHATGAQLEEVRRTLGLDRPLPIRLASYLGGLLRGDLGHSYSEGRDVLPLIVERLPATAQLALAGLAVQVALGLPLGVVAARRPGSLVDRVATLLALGLVSAPVFLVGYLALDLLAFEPRVRWGLDLFPVGGGYRPLDPRFLALPALVLGTAGAGAYARLTRTAVLDELGREYIRTARAKGAAERRVVWRHALRNALGPLVSQLGVDAGAFLGGVAIVERIFGWPGVGQLALRSIETDDVPLVMGTVVFGTACVALASVAVDLAQAALDPRLRRG